MTGGAALFAIGILSVCYIYYAKRRSETVDGELVRDAINKKIFYFVSGKIGVVPTAAEIRALHYTIGVGGEGLTESRVDRTRRYEATSGPIPDPLSAVVSAVHGKKAF